MHMSSRTIAKLIHIPAALIGAILVFSSIPSQAGECPVDKIGENLTPPSNVAAKDVTDDVIGMIDLAQEKVGIDRKFRLRRLEVKPGGIVPWHSHGDRPAIIYIVSGSITEHSSDCAVPIEHKAGEVSTETMHVAHWWQNNGSETAVLLSSDLLADPMDNNM